VQQQLSRIGHVQIVDFPGLGAPGAGSLDIPAILRRVLELRFPSWASLNTSRRTRRAASTGWHAPQPSPRRFDGEGRVRMGPMESKQVNLAKALASFDDVYSPRIVARMNDYEVRIAHAKGDHVWHTHDNTDEFFLVLDGQFDVALRDADGRERTVSLKSGDVFVVPKGTEHKPSSAGASILMFEPTGTVSTGDRHEGEIPDHVDSTAGREIES
jgi:mannose-6-phosphate isomerase-like protein (cupin superfamily)